MRPVFKNFSYLQATLSPHCCSPDNKKRLRPVDPEKYKVTCMTLASSGNKGLALLKAGVLSLTMGALVACAEEISTHRATALPAAVVRQVARLQAPAHRAVLQAVRLPPAQALTASVLLLKRKTSMLPCLRAIRLTA